MEQKIEGAIDKGFENIASGLYIFSIGFGIVLIILGVFLLFKKRGSKEKKSIANIGLICLVIGVVSIVSGFVQM